jgi:hypothetical protein
MDALTGYNDEGDHQVTMGESDISNAFDVQPMQRGIADFDGVWNGSKATMTQRPNVEMKGTVVPAF